MTRHSIVRSPCRRARSDCDAERGAMDVMMSGREDSATVAGVVLGVDTHLDLHVAVALDQLGRRLGELTVPTTAKGYESLLCWAESFGPVWCAGVEGAGSYGAGLARHLRSAGIAVFEVERPTQAPSFYGAMVSPTPETRRPRPGRCWPGRRQGSPRAVTVAWR